MHLTMDFETRSPSDIKKEGVWKYAENPFTEVLCLKIAVADEAPVMWLPQKFEQYVTTEFIIPDHLLAHFIAEADTIEAHNVEFERAIWEHVMTRHGFAELPFHKLRCSASRAAVVGIPRGLGKACQVMGVSEQKDDVGYKVMMKMCKPKKATKPETKVLLSLGWQPHPDNPLMWLLPDGTETYFWSEKPEDFTTLFSYCGQDVISERALSKALPELTPSLYELWCVDQEINRRGVLVDEEGCLSMIQMSDAYKLRINKELQDITKGAVDKGTKIQPMMAWLSERGVVTYSLDAEAIAGILDQPLIPDDCRRVLELRREYAKSSVAKYEAAIKRRQTDGRLRAMFMFHGAHTGRFSGKGMQLQNLPSRGLIKNPEQALELVKRGCSIDMMQLLWESPLKVASSCIRSVLMAKPGHEIICSDYSAIEGRILAWLAGEQYILDGYIAGLDMYKIAASGALDVKYGDVDKAQRQIGKVIELACGYQGWIGAFHSMAKNYGLELPDDTIKELILKWRAARPLTVKLWAEIQAACELALLNPGKTSRYKNIQFHLAGQHLRCRLPSGRLLWFPFVRIKPDVNRWGKPCYNISYMVEDSESKQWMRKDTYGGKLVENIVQAISADITNPALVRLTNLGWHPILHVYDEIACEEPIGLRSVDELSEEMCRLPEWADGLPVTADGWVGPRYKKDE